MPTTTSTQASSDGLVRSLNKGVRKAHARLTLERELPFGESLRVRVYRLGNGLRVLFMADRTAPVVSYQTWFRVGSRHEKPGKTGLAHLFEHLMFNETKNLRAGEFDRRLEAAGCETNAATWTDWTYYYENLPNRQLPLVVRLESDRMANLVLREPQVTSEKEVVANERRYRVDDDVEGIASETLFKMAFQKHPYHWPTIGWMQDIENFTTADCEAFYRTYYAPNNATLVIVGDVDEAEALALVQEHYGVLAPSSIPEEHFAPEPAQRRERQVTIHQPTPTEKLLLGYRSPGFGEFEWSVLTVASEILVGGRSSRLFQLLVHEEELASEVRGSLSPFRDPGLFEFWISMRPRKPTARALRLLERELEALIAEPVTKEELEKAKNRLELSFLQSMETASGKAEQIAFYDTVLGDPSLVFARLEEYRRVTAADIRRAAKATFDPRRRTLVRVLPNEKGGKGEVAA